MRRAARTMRMLFKLGATQMQSKMAYRYAFWAPMIGDTVFFATHLLVFFFIARGGPIGDWTFDHMTVFVGAFMALDGFYMATYFFGILSIPDKIRTGELDLAITRPVNTLLYVSFGQPNPGTFFEGLGGLAVALYGGARLHILSFASICSFLCMLALMYTLMFALMLIMRMPAFWMTRSNAFNRIEDTFVTFSFRLPAPAIQGVWRAVLFVALPYGLMANLPAQAMFGGFSPLLWLFAVGIAAVFLGIAVLLWKLGLRKYDSASA